MIQFLTTNKFVIGLLGLIVCLSIFQIIGYITNRIININDDWNYKHLGNIGIGIITSMVLFLAGAIIYVIGDILTTFK